MQTRKLIVVDGVRVSFLLQMEAKSKPTELGHVGDCCFGRTCLRPNCRFAHPDGRKLDEDPEVASRAAIKFMIECKFGRRCVRERCAYVHSHGRIVDVGDLSNQKKEALKAKRMKKAQQRRSEPKTILRPLLPHSEGQEQSEGQTRLTIPPTLEREGQPSIRPPGGPALCVAEEIEGSPPI